jgi:hypothetical protein
LFVRKEKRDFPFLIISHFKIFNSYGPQPSVKKADLPASPQAGTSALSKQRNEKILVPSNEK